MEPFYFRSGASRLFGMHHSPKTSKAPDASTGVVLCNPYGHEYMRTHRVFRRLAERLAENGLHALRFDFSGCGDSSGDATDGSIPGWIDDVAAAVGVLEERAGVTQICLVGRRLGATLAVLGAAPGLGGLVLWDPVLRGSDYIGELESAHETVFGGFRGRISVSLADRVRQAGREVPVAEGRELLGQLYSPQLLRAIGEIDLLATPRAALPSTLIVDSTGKERCDDLRQKLEQAGAHAELLHLEDPEWRRLDELLIQTVHNPILDAVVSWIGEVKA